MGPSLPLLPLPPALMVRQTHLEPHPSHRLPLQRHSTSCEAAPGSVQAEQCLTAEGLRSNCCLWSKRTLPAKHLPSGAGHTAGMYGREKKQQHKPTDATDVVHCRLYVTDIENCCYCRHPRKASSEISLLQYAHRASCWARGTSCPHSSCSEGTKTCLRVLMPRGQGIHRKEVQAHEPSCLKPKPRQPAVVLLGPSLLMPFFIFDLLLHHGHRGTRSCCEPTVTQQCWCLLFK